MLEEEKPESPIIDYVLEPPKDAKLLGEDFIVYCIDTSGSMSCNIPDSKIGINKTRLDAVKSSILSQIKALKENNPKNKVCIVEFGKVVRIHGDCSNNPTIINEKLLDDYDSLVDIAKQNIAIKDISESFVNIRNRLGKLEEQGCTALGPALLVSTIIASQKKGRIILCTDGCANQGLGDLDRLNDEDKSFYEKLGEEAKKNGVVINLTSIKGCDANLEILSAVSALTQGEIIIIDPVDLQEAFDDLITREIFATNVVISIFLHPAIYIVNQGQSESPSRKRVEFKCYRGFFI